MPNTTTQGTTAMQASHVKSFAAAQNVASVIAGAPSDGDEQGRIGVRYADDDGFVVVRPGQELVELRFPDCATVTIHAPSLRYGDAIEGANVSWSSSSSNPSLRAAVRTADVIAFAVKVAEQLDAWVADGSVVVTERGCQLAPFPVGSRVVVKIAASGGPTPRYVGALMGVVRNSGAEYDVELTGVAEDLADCARILRAADVNIEDLFEGGRYILRNCQREDLVAS